jgi:hypothetical protein
VDVLVVPGDHNEVLVEPNVRAAGDDLRARLSPDAISVASLLPE